MMDFWKHHFNHAAEQNRIVLYGGFLYSNQQREEAARQFVEACQQFRSGGAAALATLETELDSADPIRRSSALRLLVYAFPDEREKLGALSAHAAQYVAFSSADLKLLWKAAPLPNTAHRLSVVSHRGTLLEAAIESFPDNSHELIWSILHKAEARALSPYLLGAISYANNVPTLERIFEQSSDLSIRIEAALYLGLRGWEKMVGFLEQVAQGDDAGAAVEASLRLAYLAQPCATQPLSRLLLHDDGNVVWKALNAADVLKCSDLMPFLLEAASRKIYADGLHVPLCDEAIRVMRALCVPSLCGALAEEYAMDEIETFTDEFRQRAITHFETCAPRMRPHCRYYGGELLRLDHLAYDLLSPHSGPVQGAAFNLWAITGDQPGFDFSSSSDLITNFQAIQDWRERARYPAPLDPGGWAFQGNEILFDAGQTKG